MSNLICTTPMCTDGRASVNLMRRTFDILSQNVAFDSNRFESRMLAIEQEFEDAISIFSEWIPFNPTCCTVYDIGKQADMLTNEMNRAAGIEEPTPGPSTPPPGGEGIDLDSLILLGGLAVGAMFLGNLSAFTRRS